MTRRELIATLLAGPFVGVRPLRAVGQADDLTSLTVAGAIDALLARAIAPGDLVEAYLGRIATLNPSIQAFVTVTAAHARARARREASGALSGIPVAHKDLFETAGVRTTGGSRLFDRYVPDANAALVDALDRAGAVMVGKTNTHELGGGVTTINPFYGATRNPVDHARIPGGSSGGSAAAVAARMCAAATGSDTGGSVRIPAAFCGCVGFKPTFGLISTKGLLGASPTFDHVGFLTRTVEDAEIMFRAATPGPHLPTSGALAPGSALAPIRIGVPRGYFFDALDPGVADRVQIAIERMRARGAVVAGIDFPIDADTMSAVFDPIVSFEIWSRYGADWRLQPTLFSESFAEFFRTERPAIAAVETAQSALAVYQTRVDRVFDTVDVVLTPTVPITAPLIEGPVDGGKILRNTWPFNAAGTPAMSIPCGTDGAGLPVGLQLVARRKDDDKLLRIAREFERV